MRILKVASAVAASSLAAIILSTAYAAEAEAAAPAGNVNQSRVLAEAAAGGNWLVNGRDFTAKRFSPLDQITDKNIGNLGLAWSLDIDSPMGLAVEPIVVDGVIYISGSLDRVYAVDAATGKLLWRVDPQVSLLAMRNSWAARTNRGVAVWAGKVFVGTGDCRLLALDAGTGKQLWESPVCVDSTQTGITGAPIVGGGKVFIGYNGSDSGVRGSINAFDANTGKLAWRFWNTPGDPSKGYDNKAHEMAAKTWAGDRWWEAGGGAVWNTITYDAETGLLLYGTATPGHGPDFAVKTSGERLFAGSIVAVKADTGEYVWHYHTAKHAKGYSPDAPDYPGNPDNHNIVLADLAIKGKKRHVVMTAPRSGIFFVLDAKSGELISHQSTANRPKDQLSPPSENGEPRTATGRNWWPMSYNVDTGLAYIPMYDYVEQGYGRSAVGRLVAWDPIKQSSRWSVPLMLSANGGVLSTHGNLVFHGEATGEFSAYAANSGRKLWSVNTRSAIQSVPVSFEVKDEQYVLMPVGFGSSSRLFGAGSSLGTPESKRGPSRLLAFKLGAKTPFPETNIVVPPVPKPPEQTASAEVIRQGAIAANKFRCTNCHGSNLDGTGAWILHGAIPDLRYMPKDVHEKFLPIVMGGISRRNGMPGFADGGKNYPVTTMMTLEEAKAIHAYLIDEQWKAYETDRKERANAPREKVSQQRTN
jgi:quinohemoprotein ethanol dehydrogenase